jgi:hypothetical protein
MKNIAFFMGLSPEKMQQKLARMGHLGYKREVIPTKMICYKFD